MSQVIKHAQQMKIPGFTSFSEARAELRKRAKQLQEKLTIESNLSSSWQHNKKTNH